jgi:hypothetical protein
MSKSALELIPSELQGTAMSEADIARAVSMARGMNDKVREAADARMRFEDEPAQYTALLRQK